MVSFSEIFKQRAYALGVTPDDMAKRLGVSTARARQLMKADRLREDTLHRMCAALGMRLVVVIDPQDEPVAVVPRAATPVHETARECSIIHGTIVVDEGVDCGP